MITMTKTREMMTSMTMMALSVCKGKLWCSLWHNIIIVVFINIICCHHHRHHHSRSLHLNQHEDDHGGHLAGGMMSPLPPTSWRRTDEIRQIRPFRPNTSAHQLTTQILGNFARFFFSRLRRDVILGSKVQLDNWQKIFWFWDVDDHPNYLLRFVNHRIAPSNLPTIRPCLAFSANFEFSFGLLWNLDAEWPEWARLRWLLLTWWLALMALVYMKLFASFSSSWTLSDSLCGKLRTGKEMME